MKEDPALSKWFYRISVLAVGVFFGLSMFAGAAYAQVLTISTTSLSGYDTTAPLITRVETKRTSYENSHTVEADFLDVDSEIDSESDSVTIPDAMVTGCLKTNRKVSCTASGMKPGKHNVRVSVKDKYGNRKDEDHEVTVTDTVAPVIDSITASTSNVAVKYHDPDPSSGIASVVVYVDGIRLNCNAAGTGCDDDHDGYDDDHDGRDEDRDDYDNDHDGYDDDHDGRDEDHDAYYEDSLGGHHKSDGRYNDLDDDRDGSSSSGYTCPIVGTLSCGPHQVVVTVTDKAGNTTTSSTVVNGSGDCTAPVTTDNAPTGWQNIDVSVTLACTDAGSGCASTTYELDAGASQYGLAVAVNGDGIHTITYRSQDVAGNVETTKTATVMIDKTPPAVTTSGNLIVEATGPSGSSASFDTYATDALSGVVGGTSCTPASGLTFPLGSTTVTCSATDAAGNTGTAALTVTVADTTAPAVTTSGNVTVEAIGPSGAVVYFTSGATDIVDGTDLTSCTPASGSTFPLGSTTVTCSASDGAGNTGTGTLTVTVVDTTAPIVTYGGPSDTIYESGDPTITGSATDEVGVVSAVARIDGGPDIACTVIVGNISCPTSGVAYGPHSVVIYATDAAGNTGTANGTFCKSSGRPNLTLFKVKGPYVVAGDPYRWVTVDYRMDNIGPSAYNVGMLSMMATNGIYLTSPSPLPVLGDIAPGGSVSFSVKYYWPVGVTTYKFTNTACAYDQCLTEYFYP
ncbi:MAG: HYR domain-containing protein [Thermoleophilia bacterium]